MPVKILDATLQTFDGVLENFRSEASKNKANLILFLADKDPSTNLSWCPGNPLPFQSLMLNFDHKFLCYIAVEGSRDYYFYSIID